MHKSTWAYKLVALFVVLVSLSAFMGDFDDEKDLIKTADKHFKSERYKQCLELYSTLVANHPQDPNFNYKYGACLLIATEDKAKALSYLNFATQKDGQVDPVAFYFYGKALQMNYDFESATKQYKKFQKIGKGKDVKSLQISALIRQCATAMSLISNFKKMDVVSKKSVGETEFFRSYRLGSMKRNIIVTPEEFLVAADKKADEYSLIVHHPMNETIYLSSYNTSGSIGGKDIFKIQKMPDGTFSEPINLGPLVNTPLDEDYPYLHPNGRVLYFASKGHNSIGGYDIFRSQLDTITNLWGPAKNIGFSVNSPADDILYVSDMQENIAYFASNRSDASGNMTVYKILPNTSETPVVIVKGQVEIEGSRNHTAKITVYNSMGEELAEYHSHQAGSFIMTLEEDVSYTVGVSAPGRGESKTKLVVPPKTSASMLSKKFVVGSGKIVIDEGEALASDEAINELLRKSALLDVNQGKDVDFNSAIERPESSKKKKSTAPSENSAPSLTSNESDTYENIEDGILAEAEAEMNEIIAQKENLEKQVNASYTVANKKKAKANVNRYEIEQISEEIEKANSLSEKETAQANLEKKKTELKSNAASATASIELAKAKERELLVVEKQEELSKTYVNAIKKARASNNSMAAIKELERVREELEQIQEEIKKVKENDGSAITFAKADAAKKKVADLELKKQVLEKDLSDVKNQQKNLQEQSDATRNKGMKEEFALQIKELNDELAEIKIESNVNQAELVAAQSEYEVLSSTQNIYDEVYAQAEIESGDLKSADQIRTIQQDVERENMKSEELLGVKESPEEKTNNEAEEIKEVFQVMDEKAKVSPQEEYSAEIAKAKLEQETLESIQSEIVMLQSARAGALDKKQIQELNDKLEELKKQEENTLEDLKKYVERAQDKAQSLPRNAKLASSESIEVLSDLSNQISSYEEQAKNSSSLPKTQPLTYDIATITDSEMDALIADKLNVVQYDVLPSEDDFSNNENINDQLIALKKDAVNDLILANKAQIQFEIDGGIGEAPEAKKLQENAQAKQFEQTQLIQQTTEKIFETKTQRVSEIVNEFPAVMTDEADEIARSIKKTWENAQSKRNLVNSALDTKEQIGLLNEATQIEKQALALQGDLLKLIQTKKEEIIKDETMTSEPIVSASTENKTILTTENANENTNTDSEEMEIARDAANQKEVEFTPEITDESVDISSNEVMLGSVEKEGQFNDLSSKKSSSLNEGNEVVKDNLANSSTIEGNLAVVNPEDFNLNDPSEEAVKYANQQGYGIKREHNFGYSGTEGIVEAKNKAENLEELALDYFYKAQTLKQNAEDSPSQSKKLLKSADKMMAKGQKAQAKANVAYGELNKEELNYNKKEIEFMLEYDEIKQKDSAQLILSASNALIQEAESIRKQVEKAPKQERSKLINQAYAKEIEAIRKQNYVISGNLDAENYEEEVVVERPVVTPKNEDNEYTRKAAELRLTADAEKDPAKKRALFEEASKYQKAGNTSRNEKMLARLTTEKSAFENNQKVVIGFREQSNNNLSANKAWGYEQKADSLFAVANELKSNAEQNSNAIERLDQIDRVNEIMGEAKEMQSLAISKYQESKSSPDKEGIDMLFERNDDKAGVDVFVVNNSTETNPGESKLSVDNSDIDSDNAFTNLSDINSVSEDQDDTPPKDDVFVNEDQSISNEVDATRDEKLQDPSLVSASERLNSDQENSAQYNSQDESEETVIQQIETSKSPAEVYQSLIAEADETEASEADRVEKIIQLKMDAADDRTKSESLLAQVDELTDEEEITKKINEANTFRAKAEEKEVEAKNQELILKNNVNEAQQKRKEAQMILSEMSEGEQSAISEKISTNDVNREKVIAYLKDDGTKEKVEPEKNVAPDVISSETTIKTSLVDGVENNELENKEEVYVSEDSREEEVGSEGDGPLIPVDLNDNKAVDIQEGEMALLNVEAVEKDMDIDFVVDVAKNYTPNAKIPVDPQMPNGIIYQVQVGAFRQKIDPTIFNGLSPLVGEKTTSGIVRYKVGYFRGFTSANMAKGRIRKLGFNDAFVVVFYNGNRISVEQADEIFNAADDGEKFVYENLIEDELESLKSLGITEEDAEYEPAVEASKIPLVLNAEAINDATQGVNDNGLNNDLLAIDGLFYTVQVGVYRTPRISADLKGVSPLYTEKLSNGFLRYTTGVYRDFGTADERKDDVRVQGIKDAYVTAYKNNKRISAAEARKEEGEINDAPENSGTNQQEENSSENVEVVFKVQVGAYRAPINVETTPVFKELTNYEIASLTASNGMLIYTVGTCKTKQEADDLRQIVVNAGGTDSFVVALVNGKRIPIREALKLIE